MFLDGQNQIGYGACEEKLALAAIIVRKPIALLSIVWLLLLC